MNELNQSLYRENQQLTQENRSLLQENRKLTQNLIVAQSTIVNVQKRCDELNNENRNLMQNIKNYVCNKCNR